MDARKLRMELANERHAHNCTKGELSHFQTQVKTLEQVTRRLLDENKAIKEENARYAENIHPNEAPLRKKIERLTARVEWFEKTQRQERKAENKLEKLQADNKALRDERKGLKARIEKLENRLLPWTKARKNLDMIDDLSGTTARNMIKRLATEI